MNKSDFNIIETKEAQYIYGLSCCSNIRSQPKDIPVLSKKYYEAVNKRKMEVLPFFVLSQNYDEDTRDFELFIGGLLENTNLEMMEIPKGLYGKMTVRPKLGFLWGLAIGEAKNYFYGKWLPRSNYRPLNFEYEYHDEMSQGKNPKIDILFAIEKL